MSISFPSADFAPTLSGYTGQGSFRFWCQKVLPIVYDDSLSYYELLNKVVNYLNNVIADVATVENNMTALGQSYDSLQEYVNTNMGIVADTVNKLEQYMNDYFDNLDVQEEINNKLDSMAASGVLSALISGVVGDSAPDVITHWLEENITPTTPIIDKTLSVADGAADAKVVGDHVFNVEDVLRDSFIEKPSATPVWVQGSIATGGGGNTNSDTAVRTNGYILNSGNVRSFIKATVADGFVGRLMGYYGSSGYRQYYVSGLIGENYIIMPSYVTKIRFVLRKTDDSAFTPADVPANAVQISFYSYGKDMLNIATNESIPSGADLNDYNTPGGYYSSSTTITKSLVNCPLSDTGFTLLVVNARTPDSAYKRQFLFRNSKLEYGFYMRNSTGTWGSWCYVGGNTPILKPLVITYNTDALKSFSSASVVKRLNVSTLNVAHYNRGSSTYLGTLGGELMEFRKFLHNSDSDIIFLQEDRVHIDGPDDSNESVMTANEYLYKSLYRTTTTLGSDIVPLNGLRILTGLGGVLSGLVSVEVPNLYPTETTRSYYFVWCTINTEFGSILCVDCHNFPATAASGSDKEQYKANRLNYLNTLYSFVSGKMANDNIKYFVLAGDFNTGNYGLSPNVYDPDNTPQDILDDYANLTAFVNRLNGNVVNGGDIGWFKTVPSDKYRAYDNVIVSSNIRIRTITCDSTRSNDLYTDHVPLTVALEFLE